MRVRVIALCTAVVFVLAACGNSGDDDDSGASPEGDSETEEVPGEEVTEEDLDTNVPIDEIGVTDTDITVTVITSDTNPLGGKYAEFGDGIEAYFEMVNDGGGIYGRDLVVGKRRDDQTVANQREAQATLSEDNPFAVFIATLLFTGDLDLATENVPTFGWNINPEWQGPTNFFPNLGALCFGCVTKFTPWMAQYFGATKVGVLGYGVSAQSKLCAEGNRDSFERYQADTGAEVVYYDDTLAFGVTDLSAQVAAMKEAGVEFITTCMDINGVFTLAQEMDKQGLDVVQHMPQGYDPEFLAASDGVFEDNIVIPQFTAFEHEPQPQTMTDYLTWMDAIGKAPGELSMQGWIAAHQFHTGLKMAGPEFDRQKVIDSLNTLTAYTADGMIQPIDWTIQHEDPKADPENRAVYACQNLTQVQDNALVSIENEDGKPWLCFHARDEEWEEPTKFTFVDFEGFEE